MSSRFSTPLAKKPRASNQSSRSWNSRGPSTRVTTTMRTICGMVRRKRIAAMAPIMARKQLITAPRRLSLSIRTPPTSSARTYFFFRETFCGTIPPSLMQLTQRSRWYYSLIPIIFFTVKKPPVSRWLYCFYDYTISLSSFSWLFF